MSEVRPYGDDGYLALTEQGIRRRLVPDIHDDEADLLYSTQTPIAMRCFSDKLTRVPNRARLLEESRGRSGQRCAMSAWTSTRPAKMDATTLTLSSGSVPMLSQPEAVAGFILEAASMLDDDWQGSQPSTQRNSLDLYR